jgi:hypothetical protein
LGDVEDDPALRKRPKLPVGSGSGHDPHPPPAQFTAGYTTMQKLRGWVMPEEDVRDFISLIDQRLRSSRLEQRHHDVLLRLWSILEDDRMKPVDNGQNQDTRHASTG